MVFDYDKTWLGKRYAQKKVKVEKVTSKLRCRFGRGLGKVTPAALRRAAEVSLSQRPDRPSEPLVIPSDIHSQRLLEGGP